MISEEITFQKFGYHSTSLKTSSHKKIIAICEDCNKAREVGYYQYRELCCSCAHKSKEVRDKISRSRKGQHNSVNTEFKRGTKPISGFKKGMTPHTKGKKLPEETKQKMRENHADMSGANSPFWKGGVTSLHILIRSLSESVEWRTKTFVRDNYRCQKCGKIGCALEAHHIKRFSIIFGEFLKEYSQFSPIEDKETLLRLATTYKPFWNLCNGETLCEDCHNLTKGKSHTLEV